MCALGDLSVLCLPLSFPSIQVNLLNSLLNITNIWYINISTRSSLYQIFSKAISHPFRSQFSLYTSISFIAAIFRIFFVPPASFFFYFFIRFPCSPKKGIFLPTFIYYLMDFISTFCTALILKITINSNTRSFPRSISFHGIRNIVAFLC